MPTDRRVLEIIPEPGGKIPLIGCPVRILTGDGRGTSGTVTRVTTYRERMVSATQTFLVVAKAARSRLGDRWTESWYEAEALMPDGTLQYGDDTRFEILDPKQTRGRRFRPGV